MKKWYNVELFVSHEIKALRVLLKAMNIQYEISGCYSGAHFEIYCDENTANQLNDIISNW